MVIELSRDLHPYVVFLPSEQKNKMLSGIFGSKAAVDVLGFALKKGIANKIYQKELVEKLDYSNKTIIGNLKTLTKLGILVENMEKIDHGGRVTWMKSYKLTVAGKWFALLIADEKELSQKEKAEILQNLFRTYIRWVRNISKKLQLSKETLKKVFMEEMT